MPNLTKLQRAQRDLEAAEHQVKHLNMARENGLRVIADKNTQILDLRNENDELNQKLEAADEKAMSYVTKYNNIQAQLNGSMTIIQALLLLIATNKK